MKKSIQIFMLVLMAAGFSSAQLTTGTLGVGGDISLYKDSDEWGSGEGKEEYTFLEVKAAPHFGFFLMENIEIGADFGYNYTKFTSKSHLWMPYLVTSPEVETWDKSTGFFVKPFVQYYKFFNEKFGCFLQAGVELGKSTVKYHELDFDKYWDLTLNDSTYSGPVPYIEHKAKSDYWEVSLAPGLVWFATKNLGVTLSIGSLFISSETHKTDPDEPEARWTYKQMGINFSLSQIQLGLEYYFRK